MKTLFVVGDGGTFIVENLENENFDTAVKIASR